MTGYNLAETAQELGITPRYARALLRQGRLVTTSEGRIPRESLEQFRQLRTPAGRPTTQHSADALALMLRGGTPQLAPRTRARLRRTLRNSGPWDLAFDLATCSDTGLATLAAHILNPDSFLVGRKAQQQLSELQHTWIRNNPTRKGEPRPLALIGLRDSATVARLAKASRDEDERRRLILEHIADLRSTNSENARALMTTATSAGSPELDAILAAGLTWVAREHGIQLPDWVSLTRLPALLWSEFIPAGGIPSPEWIPEFKQANIYAEPKHFVRA